MSRRAIGETKNGTEDVWWILEGVIYPRLAWELTVSPQMRQAFALHPLDSVTDVVNPANPNSVWQGKVWSFTTADFMLVSVVDDFESYTDDEGKLIYETWIDGLGPEPGGTGRISIDDIRLTKRMP